MRYEVAYHDKKRITEHNTEVGSRPSIIYHMGNSTGRERTFVSANIKKKFSELSFS